MSEMIEAGNTAQDPPDPMLVVRRAVDQLNSLDRETSDHLSALAFVLMRVARSDGSVCDDERRRMEEILVADTSIPAEHAVLVTEIACHRATLADCGSAYAISRRLRSSLDQQRRESIIALLAAVARADGVLRKVEEQEIVQLASELGIAATELDLPTMSV